MDDEVERQSGQYSSQIGTSRLDQEFAPVEIETTHDLDLTGLSEREARSLRRKVLDAKRTNALINDVLDSSGGAASRIIWLRAQWHKFREFPQFISVPLRRDENPPQIVKGTITRVYRVESQAPDTE